MRAALALLATASLAALAACGDSKPSNYLMTVVIGGDENGGQQP